MVLTPRKQASLRQEIENHVTAERLADAKGINKGLISRALNDGYVAPALARAMGWPIPVEVMPCTVPDCPDFGKPHVYNCQTEQVKPKPTSKPAKRKPRIRIAADVTEEQRERLHEMCDYYGLKFSELIRAIADYKTLLIWPDDKEINLFTCRKDNIEQTIKQLEKYYPGEFIRKG